MSKPIIKLKNLGPTSEYWLARIDIHTFDDLQQKGAINCFEALCELPDFKPSLNFLYAMLGALENKHWTKYKQYKGEILIELEKNEEIKKLFNLNSN